MARGKHAVKSANRRAESAHEVIDRLTDQLVEAKERARQYERDSVRLPSVLSELERLTALVEAGTSDQLEKARSDLRMQAASHAEELQACADTIQRMAAGLRESNIDVLCRQDLELMGRLGVTRLWDDEGVSRETLRARQFRRTALQRGDHALQDNRRTRSGLNPL